MPETNENKISGGRLGRGVDITSISGIEDIVFEDDLDDEVVETPTEEIDNEEYERWLEESLKESKGYGQKVSYEGEIPEGDGSWYENSTHAAYDKQMAETQQLIVALKEQDAKNKARDDFIHDILPRMNSWQNFSGDATQFLSMIGSAAWYLITALAGAGISFAFGRKGVDMIPWAGIGGVIGAIIRYNGKERYSLTEAILHGFTEIGLFVAAFIIGVWSFFGNMPYVAMLLLAAFFGAAGLFIREKIFFSRPASEAFFKALPILMIPPIVLVIYFLLELCGFIG